MEHVDPFYIRIPAGTFLYRGLSNNNNPDGLWFGYDEETAKMYGTTIKKLRVTADIILLNVFSGAFHINFMDRLNILFQGPNNDGNDINKFRALLPIGLPNFELQKKLMNLLQIPFRHHPSDIGKDILNGCLYSKYRYSDYSMDEFFCQVIKHMYSDKCVGFTLPLNTHNKLMGGFYRREVYLFNLQNIEIVDTYTIQPHVMPGGGHQSQNKIKVILPNQSMPSNEEMEKRWNDLTKDLYKDMLTIIPGHVQIDINNLPSNIILVNSPQAGGNKRKKIKNK